MRSPGLALLVTFAAVSTCHAENWPHWRGPHGDGRCAETAVPLTWSADKNVRWKIALAGPGSSTPIVWGQRIFLTQALDAKGRQRALLCLDRANGKTLWQRVVKYAADEPRYDSLPYAAASPATDGKHVVASFGAAGLVCWDLDGKELWRKDLGKLWHIWGTASSPILHQGRAFLWCGPAETQYLLALDAATGKQLWRHNEPGVKLNSPAADWAGTWATPLLARVGSRDELIVPITGTLKAFDPASGKVLWTCAGLGKLAYASPVITADGIVVAFSGFHGPALAVRAGGSGDVTRTHRLWHTTRKPPQRIGSPVIAGKYCYLIDESGVAHCFEAKTGKDLWQSPRATGSTWSSAVLAGDKLLVPDKEGDVHVLEASPTKYQHVRRNSIDSETTHASLAISEGEVFLRTYRQLWCISTKKR